jgi:hypothetical protein
MRQLERADGDFDNLVAVGGDDRFFADERRQVAAAGGVVLYGAATSRSG